LAKASDNYKEELKALAEGLPFKEVEIPEYKKASFVPGKIRQERTYTRPDASMQAVGRYLMERGTVEILKPEYTLSLFTEIHWCAFQIRRYPHKRFKTTADTKKAVAHAHQLISRMEAAEEELFIANRRLIVSCVKPFYWIGQVWLPDFLQEGSRALSNAIRKFDFSRGTPFYAYAQIAIKNRLRNYFRDHVRSGSLAIRPTENMIRIKQITDKWKEGHDGEVPPLSILAKMTGIDEEKIRKLKPYMNQWERMPAPPLSLDASFADSTANLHELIEDTGSESAIEATEKSEIWSAIEDLPDRSQYILRLRFIEGRTLEETGQLLNLTRARIKQIQDESLRKLRNMLRRGPGDIKD
jgi:RNA polymerase primary sigma factor